MTGDPAGILVSDVGVSARSDAGLLRLITIDRPAKRNALDPPTAAALAAAVESARAPLRAVVITGAGPAFCAGGDLPALAAVAAEGAIAATRVIYSAFHQIVRAIRNSELPVIAAVNGPALGAGLDLALLCDLRVAAPAAEFQSTWLKAGLVPGMGGARYLTQLIGASGAAPLLLLGKRIAAQEALACGLVHAVTADVTAEARALAADVAGLPAVAVARTKAAMRRATDLGLDAELECLAAQQGQLLLGTDFQRLASSFRNRQ